MHCTAITRRGAPCRARALPDDTKCFAHTSDAAVAAAREAGRKDGGAQRGKQLATRNTQEPPGSGAPLDTVAECEDAQREITSALLDGRMSPREALARTKAITALAGRIRDTERAQREDEAHAARMRR